MVVHLSVTHIVKVQLPILYNPYFLNTLSLFGELLFYKPLNSHDLLNFYNNIKLIKLCMYILLFFKIKKYKKKLL